MWEVGEGSVVVREFRFFFVRFLWFLSRGFRLRIGRKSRRVFRVSWFF